MASIVVPNTDANTIKLSNVGKAVPRCHLVEKPKMFCKSCTVKPTLRRKRMMFAPVAAVLMEGKAVI